MILEIKGYDSSDLADIHAPWTENPTSFAVPFSFQIGEVGSIAADNYQIVVYSSDQIGRAARDGATFVLPILDVGIVVNVVQKILSYANTLEEPDVYLRGILDWEFENYTVIG